jgi:integrase
VSGKVTHTTKTGSGTRAQIRIDGVLYRKHFKRGTDPQTIREWLTKTELAHRGKKPRRTGKFSDDARVYLDAVKAMPSFADRQQHIDEWVAVFLERQRADITSDEIAAQLQRWRTEPRVLNMARRGGTPVLVKRILSASAVNKRRTALMHLFTVLDGRSEPNPVKDTPKFREPDARPRGLPYAAIEAIWAVMRDTPTRARLQVIAYTGIPHAQLAQIAAAHVDFAAKTVLVAGRHKGTGTRARLVPLTPKAVQAFKAMARHDCWGPFARSTLHRDFRAACRRVPALKAIAGTLTPYDLRHSFGTELYRVSGDIRATQVLMDHSSPSLTHRYTLGAVDARLAAALAGFGAKVPMASAKTRKKPKRSR